MFELQVKLIFSKFFYVEFLEFLWYFLILKDV